MVMGPMQPEMGRQRIAESLRRAEADRMAAPLVKGLHEERRVRISGAFAAVVSALRPRPRQAPVRVRAAAARVH